MDTILITDTQTQLGSLLAKQFLQEEFNVIAAPSDIIEDKTAKKTAAELKKKNALVVPWNRPSPLSCKNLLLRGIQKFGPLAAAFILVPPLPEPSSFTGVKYLDMETVLDTWLKGSLLLARDLLEYFSSRPEGILAFVNLSLPKSVAASPLDDLCREGLLAAFEHAVKAAKTHGIKMNAFLSRSTDYQAYADFIIRTFFDKCNKLNGKLFYFQWK